MGNRLSGVYALREKGLSQMTLRKLLFMRFPDIARMYVAARTQGLPGMFMLNFLVRYDV